MNHNRNNAKRTHVADGDDEAAPVEAAVQLGATSCFEIRARRYDQTAVTMEGH
jgi:hypothetical protein